MTSSRRAQSTCRILPPYFTELCAPQLATSTQFCQNFYSEADIEIGTVIRGLGMNILGNPDDIVQTLSYS